MNRAVSPGARLKLDQLSNARSETVIVDIAPWCVTEAVPDPTLSPAGPPCTGSIAARLMDPQKMGIQKVALGPVPTARFGVEEHWLSMVSLLQNWVAMPKYN